ncbi:MAG TPA: hypothetical protein VJU82_09320, partial [Acidobacteriaceae bacterium]|nr:hypothetical protein [Acidobacteriaceae bacterium]
MKAADLFVGAPVRVRCAFNGVASRAPRQAAGVEARLLGGNPQGSRLEIFGPLGKATFSPALESDQEVRAYLAEPPP